MNGEKAYSQQTLAYHGASDALQQYNQWAVGKEKPEVYVPSATLVAWANEAYTRWGLWKKEGRKTRLPSWNRGAAILLPKKSLSVYADENKLPVAEIKIGKNRERVAIRMGKGGNWYVIGKILSGEFEQRSGSIVYKKNARRKDGKKGKWFLMICYRAPRAVPPEVGPWLAVHRGTNNLYTVLSSGGQPWKRIPGRNLAHKKRCMEARRKDIKQSQSDGELGTGARGHGTPRRFALYDKKEDSQAEAIETGISQLASRVMRLAKMWHCQGILIEDYGALKNEEMTEWQKRSITLLPAGYAKSALCAKAEIGGFKVQEVSAMYISTKCPACSAINAKSHNHRTGVFHCKAPGCEFERDADWVAAFWMLHSGLPDGAENNVLKKFKKELAIAKKIKKLDAGKEEFNLDEEGEAA